MKFTITFTPQFREGETVFEKKGSVFTINGEVFDFSPMPKGSTLPAEAVGSDLIVGDIFCDDEGNISMKVIYSGCQGAEQFVLEVSKNGVIEDDRLVENSEERT